MVVKILIAEPIHEKAIQMLKDAGFQVDLEYNLSYEDLKRKVQDYQVLIVRSRMKVTSEVINAAPNLKVIGRAGVGLDNIDLESAQKRGIKVLSTPEASSVAVAENVFALLLSLFRKIPIADRGMKEGKWLKHELMGFELRGKRLGIIGFGRIGREVAKRAKAFDMHILVYDIVDVSEVASKLGVEVAPDLPYLLRNSDIISIHVPLTPETYHMIGKNEISMMKDGAYLINTSRGGVIDSKALFEALKSGKLAGAGLDVFESEPPKGLDAELVKLENVIATPHISASTFEAQEMIGIVMAEKIIETFRGESKA
ncbi:MAG: hydroxyacid dehydrogenase [Nitrososphaerota archaeon]|nr:hydroxyacid dehydrogenase [Nitrososphaerota archaeon]